MLGVSQEQSGERESLKQNVKVTSLNQVSAALWASRLDSELCGSWTLFPLWAASLRGFSLLLAKCYIHSRQFQMILAETFINICQLHFSFPGAFIQSYYWWDSSNQLCVLLWIVIYSNFMCWIEDLNPELKCLQKCRVCMIFKFVLKSTTRQRFYSSEASYLNLAEECKTFFSLSVVSFWASSCTYFSFCENWCDH